MRDFKFYCKVKNIKELREVKKDIAKILTVLNTK